MRDATSAAALVARLGLVHATAPLLDEAATGRAIQSLVTDDLKVLGPEDSLVLFYAGHGGTQNHRLGHDVIKTGCLIPVDAQDKIAMWDRLHLAARRGTARHIAATCGAVRDIQSSSEYTRSGSRAYESHEGRYCSSREGL